MTWRAFCQALALGRAGETLHGSVLGALRLVGGLGGAGGYNAVSGAIDQLWVYARALPFCEIAARYGVTATAISTAAGAVPLPLPTPAGGLNMTLSLWVYPNTETGSPQVIASTATVAGVRSASMVGPGRYCSPRHPTHSKPSFLEVNGIL